MESPNRPKINLLPHPLSDCKTNGRLIIPMSTNPKNLVNIDPIHSAIAGQMCQFFCESKTHTLMSYQ